MDMHLGINGIAVGVALAMLSPALAEAQSNYRQFSGKASQGAVQAPAPRGGYHPPPVKHSPPSNYPRHVATPPAHRPPPNHRPPHDRGHSSSKGIVVLSAPAFFYPGYGYYYPPAYAYPEPAYVPAPVYAEPLPPLEERPRVHEVPPAGEQHCREFQTTLTIDGREQPGYGTACRQLDGSWRIVSMNPTIAPPPLP